MLPTEQSENLIVFIHTFLIKLDQYFFIQNKRLWVKEVKNSHVLIIINLLLNFINISSFKTKG